MKRRPPNQYITGAQMKEIREKLELSQDKLGEILDISARQVIRLEAGVHSSGKEQEAVPYLISQKMLLLRDVGVRISEAQVREVDSRPTLPHPSGCECIDCHDAEP